jgi:16S rRNA (cytosine967-C5)-methyltransferase
MRFPGRIAAAIDVITDIEVRQRPASEALKDWGNSHRFAGSADRAAIGNLVYDTLRKRLSAAHFAANNSPRAAVLATCIREWGETPETLNAAFATDRFGPKPIEDAEFALFARPNPFGEAKEHVIADVPEWIAGEVAANFGEDWVAEARALAERPPLDIRANPLKAGRDKVLASLKQFGAHATTYARHGVRIEPGTRDARIPNVEAEEHFRKGWFEIQDEGSQIVSALTGVQPGEQVLDFCAGAGGKTLAMAAQMENRGQIFAHDTDKHRLAPIHERLMRSGVRNVQVRVAGEGILRDLEGRMDRVVVDAPCTGSGTWRRRPDTKWKLRPEHFEKRVMEQHDILDSASHCVRPGGYLVYITCSVLPRENEQQIADFREGHPQYSLVSVVDSFKAIFGESGPLPHSTDLKTVTLTPLATKTDGFFCAILQRGAA